MTEAGRILIVEDDADMARALAEACSELGYCPVLETTCAAGLATAKASPFPLAILDRMMPDGDSIDMLAELRHAGTIGAILMVSALAHAGHRSHGLDRGADDYLAKPFAPEELRARIRALVRRTKAQPMDNDFLVFDGLEIRVKARTVHHGQDHIPLSPKEFEL
ncbi:response regulator transcription factor, partial [Pseudosulfitobacter sp. RP-4]